MSIVISSSQLLWYTIKLKILQLLFPSMQSVFKDKMPRLMKRQILLLSAMILVNRIDKPSGSDALRLSKLLDVNNKSIIDAAFILKDYTWEGIGKDGIHMDKYVLSYDTIRLGYMSDLDTSLMARYFADRAPSWLKYGSKELMTDDLKNAFKMLPIQRGSIHV